MRWISEYKIKSAVLRMQQKEETTVNTDAANLFFLFMLYDIPQS